MPLALLDVDGVLADLMGPSLREVARLGGPVWDSTEFPSWEIFDTVGVQYREAVFALWGTKGFCRDLEPYPEAVDAVARLRVRTDVVCVTAATPTNTWHMERVDWLQYHFDIPHRDVIFADRKELVRGDLFVEDKTSTLVAWAKANPQGQAVLWAHRYNAGAVLPPGARHTNNWSVVLDLARGLSR